MRAFIEVALIEDTPTEDTTSKWRRRNWLIPHASILVCDISGFVFWLYIVLELFFLDFDSLVRSVLPESLAWASSLTIVPALLWLAIVAISMRGLAVAYIAYVVLFPLIVLIWKIPVLLWLTGSWTLAIAVLNVSLGAFSNYRYKLISAAAYACSMIAIISSVEPVIVGTSFAVLVAAVTATYIRAALSAFSAPRVFGVYRKIVGFRGESYSDDEEEQHYGPRGTRLIDMPEGRLDAYRDRLQWRLIASRGSYFFADKLQRYQRSHISVFSGIASVLYLTAITIIVFSFLYAALNKIDPTALSSPPLSAFDYVVLSFSNMNFGELSPIRPASWTAIVVVAFQRILSFLMIGIFITLLFNVRSQKYERELNETVEALKTRAKEQGEEIKSYYGYATLEEAAEDLIRLKAAFAKFAVRLGSSFGQ